MITYKCIFGRQAICHFCSGICVPVFKVQQFFMCMYTWMHTRINFFVNLRCVSATFRPCSLCDHVALHEHVFLMQLPHFQICRSAPKLIAGSSRSGCGQQPHAPMSSASAGNYSDSMGSRLMTSASEPDISNLQRLAAAV